MIRVKGLEHPICFDFQAKGGENIRLLQDKKAGVTVNAGIIHSGSMNKYGSEKTFMGNIVVITKDFTLFVSPSSILLNDAFLSWDSEIPFNYEGTSIYVVLRMTQRLLYVDFGNDVRIVIKRVIRKEENMVDYLNVYIDEEKGLSKNAGGILGQFVHKKMKIQKVYPNEKGKTVGRLIVSENKMRHKVRTYLRRRPDIIKEKYELCWSAHKHVEGLLDGVHENYLLDSVYSL